jgi:L-aminopeptidase/D-esterase-like protein
MPRTTSKPPRALPGIRIGHASDFKGLTGCTVVLCERGAVCGVDVRGSAAGTRDLAPCEPDHVVENVHAIFLTGGSAFGLDAATGVMDFLESRGVGFPTGPARVPIVPGAAIFDLGLGSSKARPYAGMAMAAAKAAGTVIQEGSVGAGTGATVGKLLGVEHAVKSGLGFARREISSGIEVDALAVVNAFGDVIDPTDGSIVAGARREPSGFDFVSTAKMLASGHARRTFAGESTTLVVVMTNAALSKVEATRVAQMAQDGMARAIHPVHTQFDGDLVFALSAGRKAGDLTTVGTVAAEATSAAILRAIKTAKSLGGVPAWQDRMP